ncbi:MAG: hypothetical protein WC598_11270 [Methanoregula sp.]
MRINLHEKPRVGGRRENQSTLHGNLKVPFQRNILTGQHETPKGHGQREDPNNLPENLKVPERRERLTDLPVVWGKTDPGTNPAMHPEKKSPGPARHNPWVRFQALLLKLKSGRGVSQSGSSGHSGQRRRTGNKRMRG